MCVTRKARGFGFTVFLSDSEPLRGSEIPRLLLTCEWTSPALTSSRRSRRCMVSPQNADVSESANYPPVKKEKKKHANSEKKILRAHKFKRKTGRFSQVPVQLPNEDSGCTTQTRPHARRSRSGLVLSQEQPRPAVSWTGEPLSSAPHQPLVRPRCRTPLKWARHTVEAALGVAKLVL